MAAPEQGGTAAQDLHQLVHAYRRHERRVFALCMSRLHAAADAEDAVHETFMRAAPRLHALPDSEASAYLAAVARSVCVNELRRRARLRRLAETLHGGQRAHDPEADAMDRRLISRVWGRLTPRERALFLHRFAGYSYEEMAHGLGVSVSAIHMGLLRARARVRRMFGAGGAAVAWVLGRRRRRGLAPSRALCAPGLTSLRLVMVLALAPLGAGAIGLAAHPPWALVGSGSSSSTPVTTATRLDDEQTAMRFTDLTVSPAYAVDRTVFASGHRGGGCPQSPCAVLLVTHDGGGHWQRLPAQGFSGGTVVLPPASPRQPAILAAGPAGLQRSDDGGRTFHTVLPERGPAAVTPSGDVVVVAAARRLLLYDLHTGVMAAGSALPFAGAVPTGIAALSADTVVVAANSPDPSRGSATLARCGLHTGCTMMGLPAHVAAVDVVATPGTNSVVVLAPPFAGIVDGAGAVRWTSRPLHSGVVVMGAALLHRGSGLQIDAILRSAAGDTVTGATFTLDGVAAQAMESITVPSGATALAATPGGRLFVAVDTLAVGVPNGLRCSADGGTTWRTSC